MKLSKKLRIGRNSSIMMNTKNPSICHTVSLLTMTDPLRAALTSQPCGWLSIFFNPRFGRMSVFHLLSSWFSHLHLSAHLQFCLSPRLRVETELTSPIDQRTEGCSPPRGKACWSGPSVSPYTTQLPLPPTRQKSNSGTHHCVSISQGSHQNNPHIQMSSFYFGLKLRECNNDGIFWFMLLPGNHKPQNKSSIHITETHLKF